METRKKMSESRTGKNHYRSIKVQINGIVYESMNLAAKDLQVSVDTISRLVKKGKATIID